MSERFVKVAARAKEVGRPGSGQRRRRWDGKLPSPGRVFYLWLRLSLHRRPRNRTMEAVPPTLTRPPGPKPRPRLGLLREFRKQPADFLERAARHYGDLVFLPLGPQKIYLASHPDFVQDILVTRQSQFKKSRMLERARVLLGEGLLTSEGKLHLRQRRLVQPAFHRDRLVSYAAVMVACAAQCRERWPSGAGTAIDLSVEMARLTLAIVARTLFSANVDSEADEIGRALSEVLKMFEFVLLCHLLERFRAASLSGGSKSRNHAGWYS
jgi:cytochrome P450